MDFQAMVERAEHAQLVTEHRMNTELLMPCHIDETSLLFAKPAELNEFVLWASVNGWEHFNRVLNDRMKLTSSGPLVRSLVGDNLMGQGSEFAVRFEFLRKPDSNWRIEAMCAVGGYAPLHEEKLKELGTGCVVHASYKPAHYDESKEALKECSEFMAEYINSYGVFSYWSFGSWYVKPRMSFLDQT